MSRLMDILGQGTAYLLFALTIGYFSDQPSYHPYDKNQAMIKLSVSHPGQRKQACTTRAVDHQRNIPESARKLMKCPRERHPVTIELKIDGKTVHNAAVDPSGLSNDGRSLFYERFPVPVGSHEVSVRMYEAETSKGAQYQFKQSINLKPGAIAVIGFDQTAKAIYFK